MRAVVCQDTRLQVLDVPAPVPERGQVLLEVDRCGICGSDLHTRYQADQQADVLAEAGYTGFARVASPVVFGHEFSGRVAAYGPGCRRRVPEGTPVVALPLRRTAGQLHAIGLSPSAPGAYAEQVLVEESFMLALPDGLSPELGALVEPMAIGWHAVRRSQISRRDVAVVIGCGPVGLAVVSLLAAQGVRTIVASDLSAARRRLAQACGATVVVDPTETSPYEAAGDSGHVRTVPQLAEMGLDAMHRLRRLPVPWHHVYRAVETVTGGRQRPVVFECVGVPGMIDAVIAGAPLFSRVVVVGVCMVPDTIRPAMAVNKEIDLRFVVGYSPLEFRDTMHRMAQGRVDARPLLTGTVGLDGVSAAFDQLGDPETHAKILIDPRSTATSAA